MLLRTIILSSLAALAFGDSLDLPSDPLFLHGNAGIVPDLATNVADLLNDEVYDGCFSDAYYRDLKACQTRHGCMGHKNFTCSLVESCGIDCELSVSYLYGCPALISSYACYASILLAEQFNHTCTFAACSLVPKLRGTGRCLLSSDYVPKMSACFEAKDHCLRNGTSQCECTNEFNGCQLRVFAEIGCPEPAFSEVYCYFWRIQQNCTVSACDHVPPINATTSTNTMTPTASTTASRKVTSTTAKTPTTTPTKTSKTTTKTKKTGSTTTTTPSTMTTASTAPVAQAPILPSLILLLLVLIP